MIGSIAQAVTRVAIEIIIGQPHVIGFIVGVLVRALSIVIKLTDKTKIVINALVWSWLRLFSL